MEDLLLCLVLITLLVILTTTEIIQPVGDMTCLVLIYRFCIDDKLRLSHKPRFRFDLGYSNVQIKSEIFMMRKGSIDIYCFYCKDTVLRSITEDLLTRGKVHEERHVYLLLVQTRKLLEFVIQIGL